MVAIDGLDRMVEMQHIVETCGWRFVGAERRRMDNEQLLWYVKVICPNGHETEKIWYDFSPIDGVPKTGCRICKADDCGARFRGVIDEWTAITGIKLNSGKFVKKSEKNEWICARGHVFVASKDTIDKRKFGYCDGCVEVNWAAENGIEHATAWDETKKSIDPIDWICKKCGARFRSSKRQVNGNKKVCKVCG